MGARMSLGYGDITARAAARHSPASAGIHQGVLGRGAQVEGRHCSFSPKHMHTFSALLTSASPTLSQKIAKTFQTCQRKLFFLSPQHVCTYATGTWPR